MSMMVQWGDMYTLKLSDFVDEINQEDQETFNIRSQFLRRLFTKPLKLKAFDTVENRVVYNGNYLEIFTYKDIYMNMVRQYKSWNLMLNTYSLRDFRTVGTHATDIYDNIDYIIERKQDTIQKIYEDLYLEYSPLENTSTHESLTTTKTGNETDTKTKSGSKTSTKTESGTETNTNVKSGNMTDNLTYLGTTTDTNTHDVSADNSQSLLTDYKDTDTTNFTNRADNRTETYNNITDTNTKAFANRQTTDTESFNNYRDTNTKTFTNRQDEKTHSKHGNIATFTRYGLMTPSKMLNEDIIFRMHNDLLNLVTRLVIKELGYL